MRLLVVACSVISRCPPRILMRVPYAQCAVEEASKGPRAWQRQKAKVSSSGTLRAAAPFPVSRDPLTCTMRDFTHTSIEFQWDEPFRASQRAAQRHESEGSRGSSEEARGSQPLAARWSLSLGS